MALAKTTEPVAAGAPARTRLLASATFRLALGYTALFALSVLALLGFIYWSTAGFMERQIDATIEADIQGLSERYRLTGLAGLTGLLAERIERGRAGGAVYLLTDARHRRIVGNLPAWPAGASEGAEGWMRFRAGARGAGERHEVRGRHFELRGGFHLLVARDVHDLRETQALIVETLGWGVAITLLLGLAGGTVMSRSVSRRIEAINQTTREIISGDLGRRVPVRGSGDDFDQLTENLNRMLDRIQSLMDGVRQVSDNIAHDLKTPLARLRHDLERLRAGEGDPAARRALVEQALAEADGLLATFRALLRIARIEAGDRGEGFAPVDLGVVVRDVAELYEPVAEERGQRIDVHAAGGVVVRGDRDLLFQAAANLLDNALKYTPEDGSISVEVEAAPGEARLVVADSGPGIPEAERGRVFRRFYRLESSRSTPGNGLGLSLVAAAARLHDADVRLEDNAPGLRVTLVLPA